MTRAEEPVPSMLTVYSLPRKNFSIKMLWSGNRVRSWRREDSSADAECTLLKGYMPLELHAQAGLRKSGYC